MFFLGLVISTCLWICHIFHAFHISVVLFFLFVLVSIFHILHQFVLACLLSKFLSGSYQSRLYCCCPNVLCSLIWPMRSSLLSVAWRSCLLLFLSDLPDSLFLKKFSVMIWFRLRLSWCLSKFFWTTWLWMIFAVRLWWFVRGVSRDLIDTGAASNWSLKLPSAAPPGRPS